MKQIQITIAVIIAILAQGIYNSVNYCNSNDANPYSVTASNE